MDRCLDCDASVVRQVNRKLRKKDNIHTLCFQSVVTFVVEVNHDEYSYLDGREALTAYRLCAEAMASAYWAQRMRSCIMAGNGIVFSCSM